MENETTPKVIIYCVSDGKIISDKKLEKIRTEFPNQKLVDDAIKVAKAKTTEGQTSYVYAHRNDDVLEVHPNATKPKYPFE
jgi:hypothetical protein